MSSRVSSPSRRKRTQSTASVASREPTARCCVVEEGWRVFFVSVCDRRREIDPSCGSLGFCGAWCGETNGSGVSSVWAAAVAAPYQTCSNRPPVCLTVRAQRLHAGATGIPARIVRILTWRSSARWQAAGQRDPSRPGRQKLLDGGGAIWWSGWVRPFDQRPYTSIQQHLK